MGKKNNKGSSCERGNDVMKWTNHEVKKWHEICEKKGREITAEISKEYQHGFVYGFKRDENGQLTPRTYEEIRNGNS